LAFSTQDNNYTREVRESRRLRKRGAEPWPGLLEDLFVRGVRFFDQVDFREMQTP